MGVFSITPLKNKNPALGEGLSAIWGLRSEARMIGFAAESAALPLRRRRSHAAASGGERARRRWRAAYSVRCCRGVNLPW
ncbi:putative non-ribosomal peptide synthase domain protein [Burkholderia pseudomallei MSHR4378]|nr:putative non-ribosomal peptide synthase domain protein [Burkholderia pseudomallei MSHR4378]